MPFVSNMINYSTFDIYCDDVVWYTFFGGNFMKQKLSQLTAPALAGVVKEKSAKAPIAYHANGKAGMLTRIINPLLGGQIAFVWIAIPRQA